MASKVFVDTDVIVDHLTDRAPFANYSSMIFELHEQNQIQIHMSALSVNNIYYVSRRLIGEKQTLWLIDRLIDNIEVLGTTKTEIKNAFQTGFRDFEDSIQYATAQTVDGIEAIITRNAKDFRKSKIAIFTPEIYIKTMMI
ncbi:MAG: PIN domain-containing protein [Saprospiraceae bacterium]|nr:MAG: PIN domain-containing protein [Saprospiraceae bacterium]